MKKRKRGRALRKKLVVELRALLRHGKFAESACLRVQQRRESHYTFVTECSCWKKRMGKKLRASQCIYSFEGCLYSEAITHLMLSQ